MTRWILIACLGCALTTSNCAKPPPRLPAAPRLTMPDEARRPCELHRLPETATLADLEVSYASRGAALVACEAARRLAVETLEAEHALEDEARRRVKR